MNDGNGLFRRNLCKGHDQTLSVFGTVQRSAWRRTIAHQLEGQAVECNVAGSVFTHSGDSTNRIRQIPSVSCNEPTMSMARIPGWKCRTSVVHVHQGLLQHTRKIDLPYQL